MLYSVSKWNNEQLMGNAVRTIHEVIPSKLLHHSASVLHLLRGSLIVFMMTWQICSSNSLSICCRYMSGRCMPGQPRHDLQPSQNHSGAICKVLVSWSRNHYHSRIGSSEQGKSQRMSASWRLGTSWQQGPWPLCLGHQKTAQCRLTGPGTRCGPLWPRWP